MALWGQISPSLCVLIKCNYSICHKVGLSAKPLEDVVELLVKPRASPDILVS